MKSIVFIASPYSGNIKKNLTFQKKIASDLLDMGYIPLALALMTHEIDSYKSRPYNEWLDITKSYISKSDILLRIGGDSSGADEEKFLAKKLNIPIVYSIDELN